MKRTRIADIERPRFMRLGRSQEENVLRLTRPARNRCQHVDPLGRPVLWSEPRMRRPDWDHAARAGNKRIAAAVQNQRRLAFRNVKKLLERLNMRVDMPAGRKRAESECGMGRAGRAIDRRATIETRAVRGIFRPILIIGSTQDVMHLAVILDLDLSSVAELFIRIK